MKTKEPITNTARFTRKRVIRLRTLILGLLLMTVVIVIRLAAIQVVDHDRYQQMARQQYERKVTLEAERGTIYDRNMQKIAVNLIQYAYAADPSFMKEEDKDAVADNLARVFKKSRTEYRKLLAKKTAFVWLERSATVQQSERIRDSVPGLIKLQSLRRYYPFGKATAPVVGITDIDNRGISGIESAMDSLISGHHGWAILQADARGRLAPNPEYPHQEPINGQDVILTIDAQYQTVALQELEKSIEEYGAESGMAVILSPKTGEILAMVNAPSFDPNQREQIRPELMRNRIITDLYEPGSTFKAISAVAAIEERVVSPGDAIYCENGKIRLYNHIIHDSKPHRTLTFTQVVEQSSNIGIIKTIQKVGDEKLYQYARAFGFGNETGIDMDGEVRGVLQHPSKWSGLSLPMIAIGQEISVTALQLANAYAAIANGGALNRPYVVKGTVDPLTHIVTEHEPQTLRTVASAGTMQKVTAMLRQVVVSGTGQRVKISGVDIAGKTGTAQRVNQGQKGYAQGQYNASFVGFFPVQDPQLVFLVIVSNPKKSIWGETSAALTARAIIERILNSSDEMARTINRVIAEADTIGNSPSGTDTDLPDVTYMAADEALKLLDQMDIRYRVTGSGERIVEQKWKAGTEGRELWLVRGSQYGPVNTAVLDDDSRTRLPDVRGLSVREALNRLYQSGVEVRVKGNGFVIAQSPSGGRLVKSNSICTIQCRPQ